MDDGVVVALFRHGITELNKQKTYMGWTDAPICERGKERFNEHFIRFITYDMVITSDLKRCLQTANLCFLNMNQFLCKNSVK